MRVTLGASFAPNVYIVEFDRPGKPERQMRELSCFALVFVIWAVATDERVTDVFAAIAIGLTLGFCR